MRVTLRARPLPSLARQKLPTGGKTLPQPLRPHLLAGLEEIARRTRLHQMPPPNPPFHQRKAFVSDRSRCLCCPSCLLVSPSKSSSKAAYAPQQGSAGRHETIANCIMDRLGKTVVLRSDMVRADNRGVPTSLLSVRLQKPDCFCALSPVSEGLMR